MSRTPRRAVAASRAASRAPSRAASLATSFAAALAVVASAPAAAQPAAPAAARLDALERQADALAARLDALRRTLAEEETRLGELRRALAADGPPVAGASSSTTSAASTASTAPGSTARASTSAGASAGAAPVATTARAPVGTPPADEGRPPVVARIFEQPGVLTPAGHGVVEPSLQYAYSSSNRIALVGYTVIPAILIGLVDVREVKRNTVNATLTGRWGVTSRLELEARLPTSYRSDTSIGRELQQGSAANAVFNASGRGLGDVEATARYQFNETRADAPTYVGSLRLKSRTGRDPFQVRTDTSIAGLSDGVQASLPLGSGFYGLQPALTALVPSDPAVFFGTVSYLRNFARRDVVRQTDTGPEPLGTISPGDVIGFNFGMGLGLNEKSSFSLGYDHASVGRTRQNGQAVAESVRVQLGTLLLGYAYRLSAERSLAVSLGAGITRDTPDVTLTVRMPVSF